MRGDDTLPADRGLKLSMRSRMTRRFDSFPTQINCHLTALPHRIFFNPCLPIARQEMARQEMARQEIEDFFEEGHRHLSRLV